MIGTRPAPRWTLFASDKRGTSAVELAIVAPVFLLILMGAIGFSIYFSAAHSLQQIAADATRTAVAGLDAAERTALASGFVARNAGRYAFVAPDRVSVVVGDDPVDPNQFTVSLAYDAGQLPIWNLLEGLPMPVPVIRRSATVRIGGL